MKDWGLSIKVIIGGIAGLAVILAIVYLAYMNLKAFEKTIVSQTQEQLLTIARTTAGRLEDYFDEQIGSLKSISKSPIVQEKAYKEEPHKGPAPCREYCPIRTLHRIQESRVDALNFFNAKGIMLCRHPFIQDPIGMDYADKPDVAFVLREHKEYISEVFYDNSGNAAISMSMPIFYSGNFAGIVQWVVTLDRLYRHYIEPIKVGREGLIWILDERKKLLIHSDPKQVGKHIIASGKKKFPDHDWSELEDVVAKAVRGGEGFGTFNCATYGTRLVAYAPIRMRDQLWSITVAMNYSEISQPIKEHGRNTFGFAVLLLLFLGTGGVAYFRTQQKKTQLEVEAKYFGEIAKSAETIRQSEEKLAGIISSVTDHMSMMDDKHNIVWANDVAKSLFGSDLVGKKCYSAYHLTDQPCEPCVVRKCFEDGKIHEHETEVIAADGNKMVFWCTASVATRDRDGRPKLVVEVSRNITDRKLAEEALQKAHDKLEIRVSERTAELSESNKKLRLEIADRERAEKALQESEQKLAGIVESVTDAMVMVNEQFDIVWTNVLAKGLLGPDLVGKKCYRAYRGRDKVCEPCIVKQCFEDGKVHEFETEITPTDGDRMSFWCTASVAARGEDGRPRMVVESLRDITERGQAQREIETLKQQMEFILGATKTGIDIIDSDYNIQYIDPEWQKVYGDPAGKKCHDYFMGASEPCPDCGITKAMETKAPVVTEEILAKEGNRPIQVTTIPFQNDRGEWLFAEVNVDITARKKAEEKLKGAYDQSIIYAEQLNEEIKERNRAEQALRESEEKYRTLFEDSRDAIYMTARDGRFMDVNQAALDLFGYTREEMLGLDFREIYVNPEDRSRFQEEIEEKGSVRDYGMRFRKKDGAEMDCMVTSTVRRADDGSILGYQGIIRDTTEQKRLEAQLLQAQKMEAVGNLAGGISHDFNNILQAISGYIQLLLMKKEADDPDGHYLKQIEKAAERAGELTRQLLVFSRKVESKLRPIDLNQELRQVHGLLQRTIPKMIDVELHLTENLKLINADPVQLEQIIMNLVVNAKDAMPDGGKLFFETKNVILNEQFCQIHIGAVPGDYALLSISDTGHGMDKKIVEHIFEPFYTTKEIGKGTGLGLAMVYGIVKSHGGYVTCYSEPGQGTVFKIYFPVLEVESLEREVEREHEEAIRGGHETILLVDDEEMLREQGREILHRYGYTTVTAENAETAIEIYKKEKDRIDLVTLDIGMPGMGGHKCLQELLKIDPDVKVIIASGYTSSINVKEALESGAAGFIGKPYDLKDMLKTVRALLDQCGNCSE